MNKGELIEAIGKSADVSKALSGKVLDSFIGAVIKALRKGDRVALAGFGTFSVVRRKARRGRNPQTGKIINIPAKKAAKFKAGAKLAKAVR